MQIKWQLTKQEQIEIMEWVAGIGPITPAVKEATIRYGVTFGAALITRNASDGFLRN